MTMMISTIAIIAFLSNDYLIFQREDRDVTALSYWSGAEHSGTFFIIRSPAVLTATHTVSAGLGGIEED